MDQLEPEVGSGHTTQVHHAVYQDKRMLSVRNWPGYDQDIEGFPSVAYGFGGTASGEWSAGFQDNTRGRGMPAM